MNDFRRVDIFSSGQLLEVLKKFSFIMSFCPLDDEPDIGFLNKRILGQKDKALVCPKIGGEDLLPCEISDLKQLGVGRWGILEPVECKQVELSKIEVVLVPGQKFDIYGYRQGRGKGYYDRFLSKLPNAIKIGVLESSRLVAKLNPNPWDVKMDVLVKT